MKRLLAWLALAGAVWVLVHQPFSAQGWDWDEVLMIAMGFAGLAYVIVDQKRERRLDTFAVALTEELGRVKASIAESNPHTIAERVATLENETQWLSGEVESTSELARKIEEVDRRIEAVAIRLEPYDFGGLCDRVTTIEARIDHKPITHTRGAKGRFASPEAGATCESPKPVKEAL